jgi:hypothetical protein
MNQLSQLLEREGLRDCLCFRATNKTCFPSAVRTDCGKWAIVRFLLAAEAAFFMFFFAAFFCFVDAICSTLRGFLFGWFPFD